MQHFIKNKKKSRNKDVIIVNVYLYYIILINYKDIYNVKN